MVNTSSNESSKSLSKAVENKLTNIDIDHFLGSHQEVIIFQAQCEQQNLKSHQSVTNHETIISHITYSPFPLKFHTQPIFIRIFVKMGTFSE